MAEPSLLLLLLLLLAEMAAAGSPGRLSPLPSTSTSTRPR
jgi:hypothetical protein